MPEQPPEHVLRHGGVPLSVGVRQRVAARDLHAGTVPLVGHGLRNVADAVERLLPRQLHHQQRHKVTPRVECPVADAVSLRRTLHEVARNPPCNLLKNRVNCLRCFFEACFSHRDRLSRTPQKSNSLRLIQWMNGMLVILVLLPYCVDGVIREERALSRSRLRAQRLA